jgi:metalloendopeptidase OMA1, mitochondrial
MSSIFGSRDPYGQRPSGMSRLLTRLVIIALMAGIPIIGLMIKGCQTGPFGRNQVVAINPEQEAVLGLKAFQDVLAQERVRRQGPLVDVIRQIASRLTEAARNEGFLELTQMSEQPMDWDVRVVESQQQNAFCLPGGKIVVYTGILPIAQTDTGLAVVLGHEISHALGHHGAERMAHEQMANIGVMAAGAGLGDMDPNTRMAVLRAINTGAKFTVMSYGRDHESEADHMGLLLMAAAGYDPRESMKFWERMKEFTGGQSQPVFLSTHPSHETRIHDLTNWIPEAMPLYDASPQKHTAQPLPDAGF